MKRKAVHGVFWLLMMIMLWVTTAEVTMAAHKRPTAKMIEVQPQTAKLLDLAL